eukprot:TRINITY_DN41822_c0_g1_i1.p1 TRINITY_DN41822_c0_g1~~TRINITY_DN41822_c0_g1_i1.p1  ORF type:complete len:236 (+),score=64.10 TRINITY_DN41822_c0_g1_i1:27-734(+)
MKGFLVVLLFGLVASSDVKGALNLDSITFDKLVGTQNFNVLVKFDKQYPYGDKEDAWKDFAKRMGEHKFNDLLLAQVGVQDYGDKLNDDLRERFGVKTDDFPVFKLFRKGSAEPITYTGAVKADDLTRFLKEELKIYIGLPGCLEGFDKLATGFLSANDKDARLVSAEKAAKALQGDDKATADTYVNAMKKIQAKGSDFLSSERKRLEKLIESKVSDDKKKAMRTKLNILASFTE